MPKLINISSALALLVLFVGPAHADGGSSEPVELTNGRKSYESQCVRAIAPITARYVQWLERSKRDYGAKGDLVAALAFENELKRVTPDQVEEPTPAKEPSRDRTSHKVRFSRLDVVQSPSWSVVVLDIRADDESLLPRLSFKVHYLCKNDRVYHVVVNDNLRLHRKLEGREWEILVPPASFVDKNEGVKIPVSAYIEVTLDGDQIWATPWNKKGPDDWWLWDADAGSRW